MNNLREISKPAKVGSFAQTLHKAIGAMDNKKPLAICGLGPGCEDVPEGREVWALAWGVMAARADVLFEMHHAKWWDATKQSPEKLNEYGLPVFLRSATCAVPLSLTFPKDEVVADNYADDDDDRPQSSIAWMLGLAIYQQRRRIELYGVDMAEGSDYAGQRSNCRYLIGLAKGRGLDVFIPATSLLHDGRVGYGINRPPGV